MASLSVPSPKGQAQPGGGVQADAKLGIIDPACNPDLNGPLAPILREIDRGAPLAKVKLPQRVPNGLHGNWYSMES